MAAKGPFLVLYGDEHFSMDRVKASKIASWSKNRTIIRKDGADINDEELVGFFENNSSFDEPENKAVILDNAQDLKLKGDLEEYIAKKDPKDLSCVVLAIVRAEKLPAVWKSAVKKGEQAYFAKLKYWETDKAVSRVIDEALALGVKLDKNLAEIIHRYLGDNLGAIFNELTKLACIAKDGVVTKKQLISVLAPDLRVKPFQVAEAATEKNFRQALSMAATCYKNMGEGANITLTDALLTQVEKLAVIRQLLDQGETSQGIAIRLGIHEYVCKKTLIPLAQKHSLKGLLKHMNDLCKLDVQVKGAARSKRTLVELAILSITA